MLAASSAATICAARSAADTALQRTGVGLLYVATALTATSAVPYVRMAWPVLTAGKPHEKE